MSSSYRLSPRAAVDLDELLEHYLAEAGADVSERVAAEFERSFRLLAGNPHIGHRREDLVQDPVRFWTVFSYHVIYSPEAEPLLIVRIIHSKREFASIALE